MLSVPLLQSLVSVVEMDGRCSYSDEYGGEVVVVLVMLSLPPRANLLAILLMFCIEMLVERKEGLSTSTSMIAFPLKHLSGIQIGCIVPEK